MNEDYFFNVKNECSFCIEYHPLFHLIPNFARDIHFMQRNLVRDLSEEGFECPLFLEFKENLRVRLLNDMGKLLGKSLE